MTNICPACEKGILTPRVMDETIQYDGAKLNVPSIEFSLCPVCGEEAVLPEQARRNEVRFADAKRAHDHLLTSVEIVAWRNRYGLTQQQASALCGGGVNAFSKYERGEVIQSRAMDLLLRASDRFVELRQFLAERVGFQFKDCSWETIAVSDEAPVRVTRPNPQATGSVVDIMAYRIRQPHGAEANDGEWHDDARYAYAR